MKWYSIKEYIPPSRNDILIRTLHKDNYERYFIAATEFLDDIEILKNWDFATHNYLDTDNYEVTHFCILEPVPIEDKA